MADEDIKKEPPEGIRKEPLRAEAPPRPLEYGNSFRRREPVRNPMARIALWLSVLSIIPLCSYMGAIVYAGAERQSTLAQNILILGGCAGLVLFPGALICGIVGLRYLSQHPTAGGHAYALFGIMMGLAGIIIGLSVSLILLFRVAGAFSPF